MLPTTDVRRPKQGDMLLPSTKEQHDLWQPLSPMVTFKANRKGGLNTFGPITQLWKASSKNRYILRAFMQCDCLMPSVEMDLTYTAFEPKTADCLTFGQASQLVDL